MKLTVGSCFSGIGGLELGLEWTNGFETKWQIENDEYASRVLAKHWPDVKRYSDIRDVRNPEPVDVICGGFPCQDVSLAGARKGLEGKRSTLWGEMFRLVCEVKPRWVVAENVPGLLSSDDGRFFGNILRDLASAGYDAEWGVLSAAGVGAPHLRKRIFIVAHTCIKRGQGGAWQSFPSSENVANTNGIRRVIDAPRNEREMPTPAIRCSKKKRVVADSNCELCKEYLGWNKFPEESGKISFGWHRGTCGRFWSPEPAVGRVVNGISNRSHRLKCLGNAVVPQVAQKIGEMIFENTKE